MKNIMSDILECEINQDPIELELIEKKVKKLLWYTKDNIMTRFACLSEFNRLKNEEKELKEILHIIYQKKERVERILNN